MSLLTALLSSTFAACDRAPLPADDDHHDEPPAAASDRIEVPAAVRQNLGIAFVTVERRRVAATLRLPGHFELLPSGRREYRTPIAGRVELMVQPLQRIAAGDLLYRIDSPQWRTLQRELGELQTTIEVTRSRGAAMVPLVEAHRQHERSLVDAVAVIEARVQRLHETQTSVGGQASELSVADLQLAQTRAQLAEAVEKRATVEATVAELEANLLASRDRFDLALEAASTIVGVDREVLRGEAGSKAPPGWRTIGAVSVRAVAEGIADALPVASGSWVEVGSLVLATTDPRKVRFYARGLQSDLSRLRPLLPARVVPPQGSTTELAPVPGELALGVEANPKQRTLDLFLLPQQVPGWARPGVAAFLEVETETGTDAELAVPLSCVLQDGLQRVLFRRDPKDQDQVIRIVADLGVDDGRWVEVKSGVVDGDQVVLAGAYELMLASSGAAAKAGHFHADGTFHDKKDK